MPRAGQEAGPLSRAGCGQGALQELHLGGAGLQLLQEAGERGRALLQALAGLEVSRQQQSEDSLVSGGVRWLVSHDVLSHDGLETLYKARIVFGQ